MTSCTIELDRKDSNFPELKLLLEKANYELKFLYDEGKFYLNIQNKEEKKQSE